MPVNLRFAPARTSVLALLVAYPLYDDMIKRLGAQQDRLFGDQKEFVYFSPGAVRIAEKSSAPVKNRAHTIETRIDLTGNARERRLPQVLGDGRRDAR